MVSFLVRRFISTWNVCYTRQPPVECKKILNETEISYLNRKARQHFMGSPVTDRMLMNSEISTMYPTIVMNQQWNNIVDEDDDELWKRIQKQGGL